MPVDLYEIKRARLDNIIGRDTITQVEHCQTAGAKFVISGVLVPGDVVTSDPSAAPVLVRAGTMCRIETASTIYVAFADDDTDPALTTVSASTTPALKLTAGTYLVAATGHFMKTSGAITRLELTTK